MNEENVKHLSLLSENHDLSSLQKDVPHVLHEADIYITQQDHGSKGFDSAYREGPMRACCQPLSVTCMH